MRAPGAVVRRYLAEVLDCGGRDALDELVANGPLRDRVLAFRAAFPDLTVELEHLIAEGDMVAIRATGRATHSGAFQGVPPTGRAWTATCTALYRVESGAIVEAWVQWDLLAILEQIGGIRRVEAATA